MSHSVQQLLEMNNRQRREVLLDGHPIDPSALDDSEYRGVSMGLPAFMDKLLWKTFMKTFHRDPESGVLRGWNVRLVQTGLDGPIEPMRKGEERLTFGHYVVGPAEGVSMPVDCPQALYLDYRNAGNALFDPGGYAAAPLVALNEGSADLLLGLELVHAGPLKFALPSYWTLERIGPLSHVVAPPRG